MVWRRKIVVTYSEVKGNRIKLINFSFRCYFFIILLGIAILFLWLNFSKYCQVYCNRNELQPFIKNNVRHSTVCWKNVYLMKWIYKIVEIETDIIRILIYILLKKLIKIYHRHTNIEYKIHNKNLIPRKLFQLKFHSNGRVSTYFWSILSIHIFQRCFMYYLFAGGIRTYISNVHGYIMTSYYLKFNISMNVSCIYS